ncbi:MAG: PilZ domain-containing protein [SAR324 cluster bacterium]|nr:PilZ domain-containing protein [SAR324 cluster bacterium]
MLKRNNKWVRLKAPIEFYLPGDSLHRAATGMEISLNGVTLRTSTPLYIDMKIGVVLNFPKRDIDSYLKQHDIICQAEVVWARELMESFEDHDETFWEAEARFLGMPPEDKNSLQTYLEELLMANALRKASGPYDGLVITECLKQHMLRCEECSGIYGHLWKKTENPA